MIKLKKKKKESRISRTACRVKASFSRVMKEKSQGEKGETTIGERRGRGVGSKKQLKEAREHGEEVRQLRNMYKVL